MVDVALIQQCADPGLKPAIVETFIAAAGSPDPLTVTVRSGNRVVLVPRPSTPDEAMELIRQHVGKAVVRVGVTQYPAGVGVTDVSELKRDLLDACANIRMGAKLFANVYRIVTKWYGNEVDEAFADAIDAWKTGSFEGKAIFSEPDPGEVKLAVPTPEEAPRRAAAAPSRRDRLELNPTIPTRRGSALISPESEPSGRSTSEGCPPPPLIFIQGRSGDGANHARTSIVAAAVADVGRCRGLHPDRSPKKASHRSR